MNKLKRIVFMILLLMSMPVVVNASSKVNVYIIVQQNCKYCEKLDDYIEANYADDNSVDFYKINIDDDANDYLLQEICNEIGLELSGTPVIVIDDYYLEGYQDTKLDVAINHAKENEGSGKVDSIVKQYKSSSNVIHEEYNSEIEAIDNSNNDSSNILSYVAVALGTVILMGIVMIVIKKKSTNNTINEGNKNKIATHKDLKIVKKEQVGNTGNNKEMNTGNNKIIAVLISALPFVAAFVFYLFLINPSDTPSNDIGDRVKMRKCIQIWEQYYYSTHFYCNYVEGDDMEDFKAVYNCNLDNSKKEVGHTYFNPQYVIMIDKEGKYTIGAVLPTTGKIQILSADCGND